MEGKVNIFSDAWCDMVFDEKNKEYGAYIIRKLSNKRHFRSLLIAVILFLIMVSIPGLAKTIFKAEKKKKEDVRITELSNIKIEEVKNEADKVVEDMAPPPLLKSTIRFVEPVIRPDEEVQDESFKAMEQVTKSDVTISLKDIQGSDEENAVDYAELEQTKQLVEDTTRSVFLVVEQMPEFPGGNVMAYFAENIKYPPAAAEANIQGMVIVQFTIERDGSVSDIVLLRGIGGGCDKEALRVVNSMPPWKPGKQNGRPVRVRMSLPVKFILQY